MVCCQLRDRAGIDYWEEGRAFAMSPLRTGDTTIHDLQRDPAAMIDCPLYTMMWFVPRAFRKSTGLAPHAWLLQARVERAMTLLR
jgi:hypothetical protein